MISALVLAAGTSSRMGAANKLLLPLAGKPLVQHVVENLLAAGLADVIVVTGHEAARVRHLLGTFPVRFVHNEGYEKGLTSSIQAGVAAAAGAGYMICLSDMPFITAATYAQLAAFFETQRAADPACICVPSYRDQPGNPAVFSSLYREAIRCHPAAEGCKQILQANPSHVYRVPLPENAVLRDVDTAEDYNRAASDAVGMMPPLREILLTPTNKQDGAAAG